MRIVFAVHTYYPAHNGVQAVTQYIAEGIAQNHEVCVITEKREGFSDAEVHHKVRIERIHVKQRHNRFYGDKKKFFSLLEREQPDILVCVCTQSWPFDWTRSRLKGIMCKKILYTHGYTAYMSHYPLLYDFFHMKLRAFLYHLYWKKYYEKAHFYISQYDRVIYLSENNVAVKYAKKHNLTNGVIMENAVEDAFFNDNILEKEEHFTVDRKLHFIYVANYDDNKNQLALIDIFAQANIAGSTLTLIGGQNNEYYYRVCQKYKESCAQNPDLKIDILFGLTREQMRKYLESADVFLCVSKHEEYPVMLCEAAAKGLAVISTDVGHASEMQGCIIAKTPDEFVKQMQNLQKNPELRRELGKQLRKYAEQHCQIAEKVKQFETILGEITQSEKTYAG